MPDNLGNQDTIWSKDAIISDTIVMMANTKVHGELITDSIQAVGDIVTLDDGLDVYGCATFYGTPLDTIYSEGFESGDPPVGWEESDIIGFADLAYPPVSSDPDGYTPTEGDKMVLFNSFFAPAGDQITLEQTSGFSTTGYANIIVNIDVLHDPGYAANDDRINLRYSIDGISWETAGTISRYDGTTGWNTESFVLPDSLGDRAEVFLGIRFISDYGYNVHIDNLRVVANSSDTYPLLSLCDGMVDIVGDINANAFVGDGSGLTGIDDADWTVSGDDIYSAVAVKVGALHPRKAGNDIVNRQTITANCIIGGVALELCVLAIKRVARSRQSYRHGGIVTILLPRVHNGITLRINRNNEKCGYKDKSCKCLHLDTSRYHLR